MTTENKTAQLITKLIRATAKGKIKWKIKEAPRSLIYETESSVPLYLQTEYNGKLLGIYDHRSKCFYEGEAYWHEGIGFCIVTEDGKVIWKLNEDFLALRDLFNTAREQASGIDDILDDLLNE